MAFDVLTGSIFGLAGIFAGALAMRMRAELSPPLRLVASQDAETEDERERRVLAALPIAALLIDQLGNVQFVNHAAERLFRIDGERIIGRALIAVVPSIVLEQQMRAALEGQETTRNVQLSDGFRERTLGATAHPYDGGAIVVAVDRTELVGMEENRRDFVANVSHELRTPLTSMSLMLETIEIDDSDEQARSLFLPQIRRELNRMIQLVESLLAIARSESGATILDRAVFDLCAAVNEFLVSFEIGAKANGVELCFVGPDSVLIDGDRARIGQIANNLVENALRFTPAGGRIEVSVEREGADAILRIRDTGSGIPFRDLPHIFDRFYTADRSRAREHAGAGLGLSIVRNLVEAHGGTVEAASQLGQGATFTCRFPAAVQY